ncbi:hypothetical protein BJ546DRAFT_436455 [Cryomyces antarcticus]
MSYQNDDSFQTRYPQRGGRQDLSERPRGSGPRFTNRSPDRQEANSSQRRPSPSRTGGHYLSHGRGRLPWPPSYDDASDTEVDLHRLLNPLLRRAAIERCQRRDPLDASELHEGFIRSNLGPSPLFPPGNNVPMYDAARTYVIEACVLQLCRMGFARPQIVQRPNGSVWFCYSIAPPEHIEVMLMRGHHSGGSTSPPSGPQDALDRRDYDRHDGYSSGEGAASTMWHVS